MPSKPGLNFNSISKKYRYRMGEIARPDEIIDSDSHIMYFGYAAVLKKGDGAFILRSDKTWRFAIVVERGRGKEPYIDFVVDDVRSIKRITPKHWSTYIRGIKQSNSLEQQMKIDHKRPYTDRFIDPELICEHEEQFIFQVKQSMEEIIVTSEPNENHAPICRDMKNHSRLYTSEQCAIDNGYSSSSKTRCDDNKPSSSPCGFSDHKDHKHRYERSASESIAKNSRKSAQASPLRRAKSRIHSPFDDVDNIQTLFEQVMIGNIKSKKVKKGYVARAA